MPCTPNNEVSSVTGFCSKEFSFKGTNDLLGTAKNPTCLLAGNWRVVGHIVNGKYKADVWTNGFVYLTVMSQINPIMVNDLLFHYVHTILTVCGHIFV